MSNEETDEASGSVWLSRDVEQPGGLSQRHTWSAHRRHSTHASPRLQSSLAVLLWAASVTRTVARMLMPSQAVDDPRPQPRRCTNALLLVVCVAYFATLPRPLAAQSLLSGRWKLPCQPLETECNTARSGRCRTATSTVGRLA